jgi:ABC-2 type transport system ATP-binding protein
MRAMQSTPEIALRCRGLVKRYGKLTAVDGLDLEVRRGECFGLLGPNGAGKTTTVEILEGLNTPDGGTVEVLGATWSGADRDRLRERVGIALQETQFPEKLTVAEIVSLFRSFYTGGRTTDEVIAALELESKRDARFARLSGGQKQRLAIACALVGDPEVLFLDEPTTGLDPLARLRLWEVVEQFVGRGGTVLLTTHYMEEAARLCDRVAIVDRGRVIALGTPAELIASLGADQVIELEVGGEVPDATLLAVEGVRHLARRDGRVVVHASDVAAVVAGVLGTLGRAGVAVTHLETHAATLEDVFVNLTGRGLREA